MKYKLICSDLDDTLIAKDQSIGKNLKDSIKRYVDAGGRFCIVTGRMTAGAMPVAKELGLTGELITYQGAVISDIVSGEILYSVSISCDDAVEIGRYIESKNYYYQTYIGDKFYTADPNGFTELYGKLSHAEFEKTEGLLSDFLEKNKIAPPKLLVMSEEKNIPHILSDLKSKFGEKFLINTSKPFIIEIIPKEINKGKAVEFLAKKYGIKREEVICVGDSDNDLTMLEYAGLPVCVRGGSKNALAAAKVIAPDCDSDAVSWVIGKYGFTD